MNKHWLRKDYGFTRPQWYPPYEFLNTMKLKQISHSSLKTIQIDAIKEKNTALEQEINQLNNFLNKIQQSARSVGAINSEQDFFNVLLSAINAAYSNFFNYEKKGDKTIGSLKAEVTASHVEEYIHNIEKLLSILQRYQGKEIPFNIQDNLQRIKANLSREVIGRNETGIFYAFRERKSQLWEDISEWILSAAGFTSAGTGRVIDAAGKQLIQDTIAFLDQGMKVADKTISSSGNLTVSLRFTGTENYSKKANQSLYDAIIKESGDLFQKVDWGKEGYVTVEIKNQAGEFKNLLDQAQTLVDNKKVTVRIEDSTDKLAHQFLGIQAKSGSSQDLLNNQKRDLISMKQLESWDKYISTLKSFYHDYSHDEKVDAGTSKNLSAYVNWIFSKNIAKTTLGKNTMFLSHYGFTTLDKIMEKENMRFALSPTPNSLKLLCSVDFSIIETRR